MNIWWWRRNVQASMDFRVLIQKFRERLKLRQRPGSAKYHIEWSRLLATINVNKHLAAVKNDNLIRISSLIERNPSLIKSQVGNPVGEPFIHNLNFSSIRVSKTQPARPLFRPLDIPFTVRW